MQYRVISADDHLPEGPDTWTSRMSKAKWGDIIPQIKKNADGTESWYINGKVRNQGVASVAQVHAAMPDRTIGPRTWSEVPTGTYVPAERIKAMERDGV